MPLIALTACVFPPQVLLAPAADCPCTKAGASGSYRYVSCAGLADPGGISREDCSVLRRQPTQPVILTTPEQPMLRYLAGYLVGDKSGTGVGEVGQKRDGRDI